MTEAFSTTLAERLACVLNCQSSGTWGQYLDLGNGRRLATSTGVTVIASSHCMGWEVTDTRRPHMQAIDRDLETAIGIATTAEA